MKEAYIPPAMELIVFKESDIITSSLVIEMPIVTF